MFVDQRRFGGKAFHLVIHPLQGGLPDIVKMIPEKSWSQDKPVVGISGILHPFFKGSLKSTQPRAHVFIFNAVKKFIEKTLALEASPVAWPVGQGADLRGVYDILHPSLRMLDSDEVIPLAGLDDPVIDARVPGDRAATLREQAELAAGACAEFDLAKFLEGSLTPVYFGSALRDDFGPDSDVDLLVTFEPDAPWRNRLGPPNEPEKLPRGLRSRSSATMPLTPAGSVTRTVPPATVTSQGVSTLADLTIRLPAGSAGSYLTTLELMLLVM